MKNQKSTAQQLNASQQKDTRYVQNERHTVKRLLHSMLDLFLYHNKMTHSQASMQRLPLRKVEFLGIAGTILATLL